MKNWKTAKLKQFAQALLGMKDENDLLQFLRDVATLEELNELSERWHVAQMLDRGVTYRDIAKETGISTTTVTRIAWWLEHGEGGYKKALSHSKKK